MATRKTPSKTTTAPAKARPAARKTAPQTAAKSPAKAPAKAKTTKSHPTQTIADCRHFVVAGIVAYMRWVRDGNGEHIKRGFRRVLHIPDSEDVFDVEVPTGGWPGWKAGILVDPNLIKTSEMLRAVKSAPPPAVEPSGADPPPRREDSREADPPPRREDPLAATAAEGVERVQTSREVVATVRRAAALAAKVVGGEPLSAQATLREAHSLLALTGKRKAAAQKVPGRKRNQRQQEVKDALVQEAVEEFHHVGADGVKRAREAEAAGAVRNAGAAGAETAAGGAGDGSGSAPPVAAGRGRGSGGARKRARKSVAAEEERAATPDLLAALLQQQAEIAAAIARMQAGGGGAVAPSLAPPPPPPARRGVRGVRGGRGGRGGVMAATVSGSEGTGEPTIAAPAV